MTTYCKIEVCGRLGQDARLLEKNEKQFLKLSLATSMTVTNEMTGDTFDKTSWHDATIFNSQLIEVAKDLVKGDKVYIEGTLSYTTVKTEKGFKSPKASIIVSRINRVA